MLRQPIQKIGMCWRLTMAPEIICRRYDRLTKMVLPNSIHHDSCSERIVSIDNPVSQLQPAAGFVASLEGLAVKNFQKAAWDKVSCFGSISMLRFPPQRLL